MLAWKSKRNFPHYSTRPAGRGGVGGGREVRAREVGARRDGVELQVVAGEVGRAARLDRLRPPDARVAPVRLEADDRVLPDGVPVQRAADERQVVQVEAAGEEAAAGGEERAQTLLRRVVDARSVSADEWREIRSLLTQARSLEYAQRAAAAFVERAKKALHVFPPSDARAALLYLPDYVVARDR